MGQVAKSASRPPVAEDLYERDYFAWTQEQGRRLRARDADGIDWENAAEEIESLGRSDKYRIASNLNVLVVHLLKWRYQPEKRKAGWRGSIVEHRRRLSRLVQDSPSLRLYPGQILGDEYVSARLKAADETNLAETAFPAECPFRIDDILSEDFWPDAPGLPNDLVGD